MATSNGHETQRNATGETDREQAQEGQPAETVQVDEAAKKAAKKAVQVDGSLAINREKLGGFLPPAPPGGQVTPKPPTHDANGRFLPGYRGGGRKPKAVERAYLEAVKEALPPDEVAGVIREALDLARQTRSWRGIVEVLELTLAYGAGRPVQKSISTDGNLETLLAALAGDGNAAGGDGMTADDVRKLAASNGSNGSNGSGAKLEPAGSNGSGDGESGDGDGS